MKNLILKTVLASSLILSTGFAHAIDTTAGVFGSYLLYKISCHDNCDLSKVQGTSTTQDLQFKMIEVQDDAMEFIASEGKIRGIALENAFSAMRAADPNLDSSDNELAEEILKMK